VPGLLDDRCCGRSPLGLMANNVGNGRSFPDEYGRTELAVDGRVPEQPNNLEEEDSFSLFSSFLVKWLLGDHERDSIGLLQNPRVSLSKTSSHVLSNGSKAKCDLCPLLHGRENLGSLSLCSAISLSLQALT
jgi:hypothetical protein